jgi:hypothetical protein
MKMNFPEGTMVISNLGMGDITFDSDMGTWNVSRAIRDCEAGKIQPYRFSVAALMECTENIEVDEAKIQDMVANPEKLRKAPPVIFATENGKIWLIDGHHRVHAAHRLGLHDMMAYVAEEQDSVPYRIYWNGSRVSPQYQNKEE